MVLTLLPFNLKTATPVTGARRTISAEFGFSLAFHRLELQTKMNGTNQLNGLTNTNTKIINNNNGIYIAPYGLNFGGAGRL